MDPSDCKVPPRVLPHPPAYPPDSLFERCSWFYALGREYRLRDHTREIACSLFPREGPRPGTRVLELGCGPGFYACRLAQNYPHIHTTGIDLSRSLIERARSRAADRRLRNCTFTHGDAHSLPDPTHSVDAVVASRLFSRIPLSCMRLLSRVTSSPAAQCREPRRAEVMTRRDFAALAHSQPWYAVDLDYDGWYQYAVCRKAAFEPQHPSTPVRQHLSKLQPQTQTASWSTV